MTQFIKVYAVTVYEIIHKAKNIRSLTQKDITHEKWHLRSELAGHLGHLLLDLVYLQTASVFSLTVSVSVFPPFLFVCYVSVNVSASISVKCLGGLEAWEGHRENGHTGTIRPKSKQEERGSKTK